MKTRFKNYNYKINKKGQAASVDALIFLSIVGIVFTFIIGYSMNYGLGIMNDAKKLYVTNYHYVALKTFMNASYGRDGKSFLDTNMADSLATMIKEDYGSNTLKQTNNQDINLISVETKIAMFQVLNHIFLPMPQRSYYLLITHDISNNGAIVQTPLLVLIRNVDSYGKFTYYLCDATNNPNPPNFAIEDATSFLERHNLDLEFVEGKFILYRNILSNTDNQDTDTKKEDGGIYLASWLSIQESNSGDTFIYAYCKNWTYIIINST